MAPWTLALGLMLGLAVITPPASGTTPSPPPPAARDAQQAAQVRAEISALSPGGSRAGEPLAVERRAVLESLAAALELRQLRASAAASESMPAPPPDRAAPPHPVPAVDAARDYVDSLRRELPTLDAALQSLERDEETGLAALEKAREQQRLWDERARLEREPEARRMALARAELARWRARQLAMQLSETREMEKRATGRRTALAAELAQWQPRVESWRREQVLDEPAMTGALAALARERSALARRLASVDARLEDATADGGPWADVAVALREQDAVLKGRKDVWRLRQRALNGIGPGLAEHRRILDDAIAQIDARRRWAEGQLAFDRAAPARASADDESLEAEAALLQSRRQLLATLTRSMTLLERTRDDLADSGEPTGVAQAVHGWLAGLAALARNAWETELFVVTDSVTLDGREVTREHGITVGKSLGAALLLGLGFIAIRRLVVPGLAIALDRAGVPAGRRRTIGRWIFWLLVLVLAVVVLKLARIPLVAFAFLGGALAIGIGFGAQTLLRNLMSGLLLLAERKVQVGDLLTIEDTSGTCTDVGLRATTLHGFDGIDLIIPNSMLLENTLKNWRSSDGRIRREVRVFVPYDHPAAETAEIVKACAPTVPGVLGDPAPEVLLVRLGEDGYELALQVWLTLGAGPSASTIESQLRFAVALALAHAGIEPGWTSSVRMSGPAAPSP